MSCQIESHIVDLARGLASDQDAQLSRHLLGCPSCAGLLERERVMSAALRRLARDLGEPPVDPRRELTLLAMFDQRRVERPSHVHSTVRVGLIAAGLAFAAILTWDSSHAPGVGPPVAGISRDTHEARAVGSGPVSAAAAPRVSLPARGRHVPGSRPPAEAADSAEFVAWPGTTAWPPFESGELIRVDIPTDAGVVQADVLVGQDGFARAVRLVQ